MPDRIEIKPEPLPWWRRFLGLGRPKAAVQRDLDQAVTLANQYAAEAEEERKGRLQAAEKWAATVVELQRRRNVTWLKPPRRPREDVVEAFAEPLDEGLQAAVHQELDDYLQELLDQVSQAPGFATGQKGELIPTMTPEQRLHLAGGIEHLRLFQKQLLDLHEQANRREPEEKDEEGGA